MAKTTTFDERYLNAMENCPFECEGECNGEKLDKLCEGNVFQCPTEVYRWVPGVL